MSESNAKEETALPAIDSGEEDDGKVYSDNYGQTACDELAAFVSKNCPGEETDFSEALEENPDLTKLAKCIVDTVYDAKSQKLNEETAHNVEIGLCYLIRAIVPEKDEKDAGKSFVDYTSLLAQNPSDINFANLQITELKRRLLQMDKELDDAKNEVKRSQAETDKEIQKNAKLIHEKEELENQRLKEKQCYKAEIGELEDKLANVTDTDRRGNDTVQSLQKRFRNAESENEALKHELEALKQRLAKKTSYINSLRTNIKMGDIKYEELQTSKNESEMNLSSIFMNQSRIHDEKTKSCVTKLIKFTKEQGEQLTAVTLANHRAADVIERLSLLMEEYEDRLQCSEADNFELKAEMHQIKEREEDACSKENELQSLLETRTEELTELRSIVSSCIEYVTPKYNITPDQLPEVVCELSGIRIDSETQKTLEKLNALADALTQFSLTLIRNNYADIKLLKPGSEPIFSDGSMRLDVLNEIGKAKSFLESISYKFAEEDPIMAFLAGYENYVEFNDSCELNAASVLAVLCSKMREITQNEMNELLKVKEVLPFVCTDAELPSAVSQYLLELQPVFKQLREVITNTLHYHGSTDDIFSCLGKYIEETSVVMRELDEEVRPLIGFTGKIVSMPKLLVEALVDMKENIDLHRKGISRDLANTILKADQEKSQFKRKIIELNEEVSQNKSLINTLRSQLEDAASQLQETQVSCSGICDQKTQQEQEIEQLKDSNQALETAKELLISERDRLENIIKTRQQQADERLQEAIEHEKQIGLEENERQNKRHQEEIQVLSMQINKLSKKLNFERKKSRDKSVLYNELSTQNREEIKKLNAEKQELTDQLDAKSKLSRKVERLEKKLVKANETNQSLTEEVSIISAQSPRESPVSSIQKSPNQTSIQKSPRTPISRALPTESVQTPRSRVELDTFVQRLGNELEVFLEKEIHWTRERVISTIKLMVDRITTLQNELYAKNLSSSHISHIQEEWSDWADELLAQFGRGYRNGMKDSELREKISDIVRGANGKNIEIIESLRQQKAIISHGIPEKEESGELTFSDLAKASMFIACSKPNPSKSPRVVVAKQNKGKSTTSLSFI